jgi:hypothetical protein
MNREPDLTKVGRALRASRRFSTGLNGGKENRGEDRDQGDHQENFEKRHPPPPHTAPLGG